MKRTVGVAIAAALGASGLGLLPAVAHASAGEDEWRAGLATSFTRAGWMGLELGWLHNLTDFWSIGATLRDRRVLGDLPDGVAAASVDARFVIDALQWVPALGVGVGGAVSNLAGQNDFQPFLRLEASLGYRPAPTWGVALHVGADRRGGADGETLGTVSLSYQRYTGAGTGLDL